MPDDLDPEARAAFEQGFKDAQRDVRTRIQTIVDRLQAGVPAEAQPVLALDTDLARQHGELDLALKKKYATRLLQLLGGQIAATNGVFVLYAWLGKSWAVPDGVMIAWMGTTVADLVGVIATVTRYLFRQE